MGDPPPNPRELGTKSVPTRGGHQHYGTLSSYFPSAPAYEGKGRKGIPLLTFPAELECIHRHCKQVWLPTVQGHPLFRRGEQIKDKLNIRQDP